MADIRENSSPNNKILIYAQSATSNNTNVTDTTGYYYPDADWQNSEGRDGGAKKGIASSIEYNTALRQATFMARLLAQIQLIRYPEMVGSNTVPISADVEDPDTAAINYAKKWSFDSFLLDGEVKSKKIGSGEVKTPNIENGAVTPSKLDKFIRDGEGVSSVNGLTVTLSKNDNGVGIKLEGNTVDKATTVQVKSDKNKKYMLLGTLESEASGNYSTPVYRDDVYVTSDGMFKSVTMEATSYNATSDKRLKQDIRPAVMNATNVVNSVQVVDYKYKAIPDENQIGIIAQSLSELCPELVVEGDDGYLRIKESKLVYVLWKALQESNKRIDELEKKLNYLLSK